MYARLHHLLASDQVAGGGWCGRSNGPAPSTHLPQHAHGRALLRTERFCGCTGRQHGAHEGHTPTCSSWLLRAPSQPPGGTSSDMRAMWAGCGTSTEERRAAALDGVCVGGLAGQDDSRAGPTPTAAGSAVSAGVCCAGRRSLTCDRIAIAPMDGCRQPINGARAHASARPALYMFNMHYIHASACASAPDLRWRRFTAAAAATQPQEAQDARKTPTARLCRWRHAPSRIGRMQGRASPWRGGGLAADAVVRRSGQPWRPPIHRAPAGAGWCCGVRSSVRGCRCALGALPCAGLLRPVHGLPSAKVGPAMPESTVHHGR